MRITKYIRENGFKHTIWVLYRYKIDKCIEKIMGLFLKNKPLKNIIVIESHNDFDSNGGAFYHYLIKHHYNENNKIVWFIKNPLKNIKLPNNVFTVPLYRPSIKKNYYKWTAKWFTWDNECASKLRENQIAIYFGHGGFGLKNCKGYITLPNRIDYIAMPSHALLDVFANQLSVSKYDTRLCYIGFPYIDNLYDHNEGDLKKITKKKFAKVVLWMPTFRKGGGFNRQDSQSIGLLGIPLINSIDEYKDLNEFLRKNNMLLILKIHPMQDISVIKVFDMSNIKVLHGKNIKILNIDNYRLMKDCDALISDYSSAAYDFLHCNKPIAYDFSDLNDYKLGLAVDDTETYTAGNIIKSNYDLFEFLENVANNQDTFFDKRQILRKKIFDFYDGNNCKRAVDLLEIKKEYY